MKAKNLSSHSKYSSILKYIFGSFGDIIAALIMFLDQFGVCVMYLIILKTSIRKLIVDSSKGLEHPSFISDESTILILVILL